MCNVRRSDQNVMVGMQVNRLDHNNWVFDTGSTGSTELQTQI